MSHRYAQGPWHLSRDEVALSLPPVVTAYDICRYMWVKGATHGLSGSSHLWAALAQLSGASFAYAQEKLCVCL